MSKSSYKAISMKHSAGVSEVVSASSSKRQVRNETFHKWQCAYEKEHQLMTWLRADMDKSVVSTLWCAACQKYENQISGHKHFSRAWIDGSSNQKTTVTLLTILLLSSINLL